MAAAAMLGRRKHSAYPAHPPLAISDAHVEAVLLGRGEQPSILVYRRVALETRARPRRLYLRAVPLTIRRTRQSFVPDLKRLVKDVFEKCAFSRDDRHAAQRWIVPATLMNESDVER